MFSILCAKGMKGKPLVFRAQRHIHRQPAFHRLFAGFTEGALQQLHLLAAQGLFEPPTFFAELQQAFALIGLRRHAAHQVHFLQLAQRHVQRLLAHPQQCQQLRHAQGRVAGDKKHNALMDPAQAATFEHFIGLGGERLVAEEKCFHGLLLAVWVFKVNHVDVSR